MSQGHPVKPPLLPAWHGLLVPSRSALPETDLCLPTPQWELLEAETNRETPLSSCIWHRAWHEWEPNFQGHLAPPPPPTTNSLWNCSCLHAPRDEGLASPGEAWWQPGLLPSTPWAESLHLWSDSPSASEDGVLPSPHHCPSLSAHKCFLHELVSKTPRDHFRIIPA